MQQPIAEESTEDSQQPADGTFAGLLISKGVLETLPEGMGNADNRTVFRELVKMRDIGEEPVLKAAAEYLDIAYLPTLEGFSPVQQFALKVPFRFAFNHGFIALEGEGGRLVLAMCEPFNLNAADEVCAQLGLELEYVAVLNAEVEKFIHQSFQKVSPDIDGAIDSLADEKDEGALISAGEEVEDLIDIAERAPVVKLVSSIFSEALRKRASDVHFQPQEDCLQVRVRVDGLLHDLVKCPRSSQDAVLSRLKVIGRMDIAEKRAPQDGRASLLFAGREVDLRISIIPCSSREQAVIRILDRTSQVFELSHLGFGENDYSRMLRMIHSVHGVMLVTGPTGSGKSTTLYAALSELNSREKHIITVEDPVEYKFEGISQMQVQPKKNLTFATCLRSIVRQDPDVIMIGEIRDHETASLSVQAALTGHMVFSTLHTNDSPGSVTRLLDLGVEPYLVASSVIGVMAQRLVRKVCPKCASVHEPVAGELADIGLKIDQVDTSQMRRGQGCDYCMDTGFSGRCGIYELMSVSENIRRLIIEHATASVVKDQALKEGLKTLRMDGARKVLDGISTVDEVLRVTQMDEL